MTSNRGGVKPSLLEAAPTPMPPPLQDMRDVEERLVELEHLRTLNIEVGRERGVTQRVQSDVEMLRN